ncbi:MAG: DUF1298 domain-containing protein [Acidimicrobiaceae bacterium]|nr:DUF1298 domain-containing protein [Acidimicrobiaceae bacterium]
MEKLSGMDAGFWYLHGKNSPMYLGAVLKLEPEGGCPGISAAELIDLFTARRGRLLALTKKVWTPRLGIGFPHWIEDEEFDLDYHIVSDPEPIDPTYELDVRVAEFLMAHLEKDRPPWQIRLFYDREGRTFLIVKLHHALLDGGLGLELLSGVVDLEPDFHPDTASSRQNMPSNPPSVKTPNPVDAGLESIIDLVSGRIPALLNLKRRVSEAKNHPEGHFGDAIGSLFSGTKCEISGTLSDQREFRTLSFPLAVLSRHAARLNTTLNNALLSVIAGAMKRYFDERGLDPIESLVALVPISLRGQEDGNQDSKNRLMGMLVKLPTGSQSAIERLDSTTRAAINARKQADSLGSEVLFELGTLVATPLISLAVDFANELSLLDSIRPLFNLVISNLAGVDFPLYLLGRRISSIIPIGPLAEGSGLNVTAYSYMDQMELGVMSCPRLLKDPDLLVVSIIAELDEVDRFEVTV